jgi:hypothetical protein
LKGEFAVVRHLLDKCSADPSIQDSDGRTPPELTKDEFLTLLLTPKLANPTQSLPSNELSHNGSIHESKNPHTQPQPSAKKSPHAYIPPSKSTFLPAAKNSDKPVSDEDKLAASRERALNKMKSKEPDVITDLGKRWDCHGFIKPPPSEIHVSGKTLTEKPQVVSKLVKDNWIKKTEENEASRISIKEDVSRSSASGTVSNVLGRETSILTGASSKSANQITALFEWATVDTKLTELEEYLGIVPHTKVNANQIRHPSTNQTLLHVACQHGQLSVAQLLVEGVGVDLDLTDRMGCTALHTAVTNTRVLVVRYLVKYCGADLLARESSGKTPLDLCQSLHQSEECREILKILLKAEGKSRQKRTKISTLPTYVT